MIINPYSVGNEEAEKGVFKKEGNNISSSQNNSEFFIKEVSKEVIETGKNTLSKKEIVEEKIKEILYDKYKITDLKIITNVIKGILNQIYGYGILQKYIDNKDVSDIRVVDSNQIYVKIRGKWSIADQKFESRENLEEYIRFCAMKNDAIINFENPICIFSDKVNGLRIEVGIEPSNIECPNMVIRVHRKENQTSLEELFTKFEMLNAKSYLTLKNIMGNKVNIVLCGKGGSGKTTLLRALINEIPKETAITTNEETAELYLKNRNAIQRECVLGRSEEKNITLEKLSKHSLVMSNDVIIIRGA